MNVDDCGGCQAFMTGICHRHAPGPSRNEHETAKWPLVRTTDRCGSGIALGTKPRMITCERCQHWLKPAVGIDPGYLEGRSEEWWSEAGYCTRFAPSPSGSEPEFTYWRVTAPVETCGDGKDIRETEE